MNDVTTSMQAIDEEVHRARWHSDRDRKFARLQRAFSPVSRINVSVMMAGIPQGDGQRFLGKFHLGAHYARDADIAIIGSNRVFATPEKVEDFRRDNPDCLFVAWLSDNHHIYNENQAICDDFDVAVPAHYSSLDYLYSRSAIVLSPTPWSSMQWFPEQAAEFFRNHMHRPRANSLYGGFREYHSMKRNDFIKRLALEVSNSEVKLLSNEDQKREGSYFTLTPEQQFVDWMSYKVSVIVCVKSDIPMRLFDALLTGQIPLVPWDVVALDAVISPEDQAALPVLRYTRYDPQEISRLRDAAVERFDREGERGALRRHRYAIENHMPVHRVRKMLAMLDNMAHLSGGAAGQI